MKKKNKLFNLIDLGMIQMTCGQVTNHMVAGEAGSLKPALGESWKSIPHVRLLLSRNHATNGSSITILKHPCLVRILA